jgi:hypothetical protein
MKKPFLLIITLALFFTSFKASKAFAQDDKWNYTLNINQRDIGKLHDTVIFKKRYLVSYIKIKLSNNSGNALNYITYSCSWDDLFHSNNKVIKVCVEPCQSNYPIPQSLAAHKTTTFILPVIVRIKPTDLRFKIGMNLFFDNAENRKLFPLPVDSLDNVIWSNEAQLK